MTDGGYQLGASEIFTLLFVMLGPIKLLGPFARATAGLDGQKLRSLAIRAAAIGAVVAIAGGFLGEALLEKWQVPVVDLRLAGGLIFLVVAFRMVLQPYREPGPPPAAPAAPPAAASLVFPLVITPYGIAAVIVLLALSHGVDRTALIVGLVLLVVGLDLFAMLYVRPLMRMLALPLQAIGAVLGVLQVAVALQMILTALRHLGVVGGGGS